ncbi:hypothetical protein [Tenacibaculum sp. 190524A02b]|uniref:hypothetical protein n=1 Tax=Tenacibaculum vairaonense TaxID=3137860 RepID=UPI0031FB1A51
MKRTIKTLGMTMGLLLLTGTFFNCTNSKKAEKETTPANETAMSVVNDKESNVIFRKPVVFITGYDKKSNNYYASAKTYFKGKDYQIIENAYSLEEIIQWLNSNASKNPYGEIHIVNQSNPWLGMDLETTVNGDRITSKSLQKSMNDGNLPSLKSVIAETSKIILHGNQFAKDTELVNTLKSAFITDKVPQLVASPYFTVFGGKFTNHYLAKPYYVFYPTANSPGKVDLSKEIARKYPKEDEIEWFSALTNEKERYIGEPYTTQFNVPIKFEFNYDNSDEEIPSFTMQEEVMDWIANDEDLMKKVNELKIPVDKYRWNWKVKNNTLVIKGLSTVLCVLKPITKPYGDLEHVKPETSNKRLYARM